MKLVSIIVMLGLSVFSASSVYDFKVNALDGKLIDLAQYKGKTLLIVNTASACGYTPQYADLQKLHEQYGDKITVLGFPANNFGAQEPGTNKEIGEFCQKNYGVSFTMMEKIRLTGAHERVSKRIYVHGTVLPRESPFKPFYEQARRA